MPGDRDQLAGIGAQEAGVVADAELHCAAAGTRRVAADVIAAQVQRHAVVTVPVLAHPDQAAQAALEQRELGQLLVDRGQLGAGGPDDLAGGAGLGGPEQVADLAEREAHPPGPADEGQPPLVRLGVLPEAAARPLGLGQQAPALVEAHRLDADARGGGELANRQSGHAHKLAAVPRYGVNPFTLPWAAPFCSSGPAGLSWTESNCTVGVVIVALRKEPPCLPVLPVAR